MSNRVDVLLTEYGIPKTGLSVVLSAYNLTTGSGTPVFSSQAMTEVGGGFYNYTHSSADPDVEYGYIAYSSGLPVGQQYAKGTSTTATNVATMRKMLLNRWKIDHVTKRLIVYDDDGTTPFKQFDLKDILGNASITNYFERTPV